ncbi:hypothetical protein Tco_0403994 [Tanacetum coccineum]
MAEYSQKWHNGTSSKTRSSETSDGLAAIQAQLNNLEREIKKVNEKVYAAQVGYELCKGPHYTKDFPLKEEWNTLEKAYYTQQTLEESLTKFMAESAKRHAKNSNIIKEIRASTDAAVRNQRASIKTLEIQIGQMSNVLQERGIEGLPGSTEPNPRDHVKSITTSKADSSEMRLCDVREAKDVKILEAYDHTLPQKEKDPGSFTLPCFIHNVCFDKALVDLGASVSVMPFSTYTNLGLGILSHTRLTIELADRTIKQLRGIAENVLVRIGKFIFPIDFIILDIPEDDDDKDDHEGKSLAGALKDIPSFVGKFSILTGFIIIDNDDVIRDVALGMPLFMKYVSCQMVMKKFAHGDKCERMMEK